MNTTSVTNMRFLTKCGPETDHRGWNRPQPTEYESVGCVRKVITAESWREFRGRVSRYSDFRGELAGWLFFDGSIAYGVRGWQLLGYGKGRLSDADATELIRRFKANREPTNV